MPLLWRACVPCNLAVRQGSEYSASALARSPCLLQSWRPSAARPPSPACRWRRSSTLWCWSGSAPRCRQTCPCRWRRWSATAGSSSRRTGRPFSRQGRGGQEQGACGRGVRLLVGFRYRLRGREQVPPAYEQAFSVSLHASHLSAEQSYLRSFVCGSRRSSPDCERCRRRLPPSVGSADAGSHADAHADQPAQCSIFFMIAHSTVFCLALFIHSSVHNPSIPSSGLAPSVARPPLMTKCYDPCCTLPLCPPLQPFIRLPCQCNLMRGANFSSCLPAFLAASQVVLAVTCSSGLHTPCLHASLIVLLPSGLLTTSVTRLCSLRWKPIEKERGQQQWPPLAGTHATRTSRVHIYSCALPRRDAARAGPKSAQPLSFSTPEG